MWSSSPGSKYPYLYPGVEPAVPRGMLCPHHRQCFRVCEQLLAVKATNHIHHFSKPYSSSKVKIFTPNFIARTSKTKPATRGLLSLTHPGISLSFYNFCIKRFSQTLKLPDEVQRSGLRKCSMTLHRAVRLQSTCSRVCQPLYI